MLWVSDVRSTFFAEFSQCYANDTWGMQYMSVIRGFRACSMWQKWPHTDTWLMTGMLRMKGSGISSRPMGSRRDIFVPKTETKGRCGSTLTPLWLALSSTNHYCFFLVSNSIIHEDVPWNLLRKKMNGYVVSWKGIKKSFLRVLTSGMKKPCSCHKKGLLCILPWCWVIIASTEIKDE